MFDGGYSEYAVLKADFVTPLPDGLDPSAAAPLMCAGLTAGAERFIATQDTAPAEALAAWDGGANLILNATPSTEAAAATFTGLAPDGWLVLCGYGPEPLSLPTQPMVLGRLHAMINPSGSPHDARDTLAFSAAHGILPEFTPIGLRDANAALDAMARGNAGKRSVIAFE
jgi:propanol-preferring alcohol dehydrogenase